MYTIKQQLKVKTINITKKNISLRILLFVTGLLFSQVILLNILYTQHPNGGWVTLVGNIPTSTLFMTVLLLFIGCLIALWRFSSITTKSHQDDENLDAVAVH